jgi:hypothetical protein
MTDLVPLLETSSDETELAVLRSLAREEPSSAVMARTAAALGLGAVTLTAAGTTTAAGAATGIAKGSIWGPVLKALAVGLSSGVVVSAGALGVLSQTERDTEPVPVAATPVAPVGEPQSLRKPAAALEPAPAPPVVAEESNAQSATPAKASAEGLRAPPRDLGVPGRTAVTAPEPGDRTPAARATFAPVEPPERAAAAPASVPIPAASATTPGAAPKVASATPPAVSIAEEVRAVDRARQALASGRARDALNELERYQAQWPRGVFTSEVLVLRVEAKLKLGDRPSAVREARTLIDARPNSRYAARLRALIETSQ